MLIPNGSIIPMSPTMWRTFYFHGGGWDYLSMLRDISIICPCRPILNINAFRKRCRVSISDSGNSNSLSWIIDETAKFGHNSKWTGTSCVRVSEEKQIPNKIHSLYILIFKPSSILILLKYKCHVCQRKKNPQSMLL